MTAVQPPGRYGALERAGDQVADFVEKPQRRRRLDQRRLLRAVAESASTIIEGDATPWEAEPMAAAGREGELMAFEHHGFWQPMDTLRDKNQLESCGNPARRHGSCGRDASARSRSGVLARQARPGHRPHRFQGGWLALWLQRLGARVTGVALPPETEPNLFDLAGVDELATATSATSAMLRPWPLSSMQREARDRLPPGGAAAGARRLPRAAGTPSPPTSRGTANVLDALRGLTGERARSRDGHHRQGATGTSNRRQPYREDDALGRPRPLQREQGRH